ncbi:hypothetical protein [Natrinema salaciae]|uniref:Ribbon-helix-helix protein, copG family n=1 Tax=Natrinema salaciae TaxID=1186196 RepID=A0A1H9BK78_9EURY|nr:hypothetical protein [Natrinema salaciae]SEP89356.1 hypothetical protein SAMN04489841_0776 [Natrinema salaciae]
MSSQDHDESGVAFALPAAVDDWLAEEATRRGETRDDVCRRLVTAAHTVATADGLEPADRADVVELQGQLEAQREEFAAHLEDVRDRVIQVKRETDGKAPADHDHDELPTEAEFAALSGDLDALETTVEAGFDNFETVLDDLLARTDDLERRSTLVAQAVVDLRDRRTELADRQRTRAAVDDLKLAANRLGIDAASCTDCGSSVDVALLTAPECPHCGRRFADVAEKSSLFGSPRLVTGDPPALEGRVEDGAASTPAVFAAVESEGEADAPETEPSGSNDAPSGDGR